MLSTRTRYSIIALCDIARGAGANKGAKRPVSLVDIAERHGLSLCYLEQLAVRWRRAGFVKGVRGPSGGYTLCCPAADISVGDIATAMEEAACCSPECPDTETARQEGCPAQLILDLVTDQMQRALGAISLADLSDGRVSAGKVDGIQAPQALAEDAPGVNGPAQTSA